MRHLSFTILLFVTLMCGVVFAHDPGLSSLDVQVTGDLITASLSMAAADVASVAAGGEAEMGKTLTSLARDAISFSADGATLHVVIDEVTLENGAARVSLSTAIPQSRDRSRHLLITSEVSSRVSRGHRQLLTVSVNGRVVSERLLDAESVPVVLDVDAAPRSAAQVAWQFTKLGVHHILSGYDHLVFLAGLLLMARVARDVFVGLTAFTAAHSLSLAMVTMGAVRAPASIVEPLIAASIAWVGVENLLHLRSRRLPLIVFGFGLIHGFGFAGALIDLGVGSSAADVALPLLSFNAGVEAGQLAVAGCLFPLLWMMRSHPSWWNGMSRLCSVSIVLAGAYWFIERLR